MCRRHIAVHDRGHFVNKRWKCSVRVLIFTKGQLSPFLDCTFSPYTHSLNRHLYLYKCPWYKWEFIVRHAVTGSCRISPPPFPWKRIQGKIIVFYCVFFHNLPKKMVTAVNLINCCRSVVVFAIVVVWIFVDGQRDPNNPAAKLKTNGVTNLTVCWILEDDSYYTSYQRLAASVNLAIKNANAFILPKSVRLQLAFKSAGPSRSDTQYSVTSNVMDMLQAGISCNMFLGAGKFTL